MNLNVKILREFDMLNTFYTNKKNYNDDAGLDLIIPENHIIPGKAISYKIPLGIQCEPYNFNSGYYLYPRSSIIKTSLRLANSVGIIDYGYRGEIMAVVDNVSENEYLLEKGKVLFQLCSPSLLPLGLENIYNNDYIFKKTERGVGGFGSTN